MRSFGDKDNNIWLENIFSFENSEFKNNKEFEEIEEENFNDDLFSNSE